MTDLEKTLGSAKPDLLDPQYAVAVARHKGIVHWLLLEHENLVLDWEKRRDEFVAAGYQFPDLNVVAVQSDLLPEYPYRSKLEVRLLLSAPKRARSSHETFEIYRRANRLCVAIG